MRTATQHGDRAAVTALVVAILYYPCRWFADLKARGDAAWLRYL